MSNESSQLLTDLDATPVVKHESIDVESRVRVAVATLTPADMAVNGVKRFVRIPSRCRVEAVEVINDDLDSNATPALVVEAGLYDTAANGGAAVSAGLFGTGFTTLQAATTAYTDLTKALTAANRSKQLWGVLGLSSDPGKDYDVALTVTTAAATYASGNVTLRVKYVVAE